MTVRHAKDDMEKHMQGTGTYLKQTSRGASMAQHSRSRLFIAQQNIGSVLDS